MLGADFRFSDAVGIDLDRADIRYSDLRNADLTKANIATTKIWGSKIRNTSLPSSVGHLKLLLKVSQVAELVREREAARKRRPR